MDLNNDGDFTDTGEADYATSTLSGGSATFDVAPALAEGLTGCVPESAIKLAMRAQVLQLRWS